MNPNDSIEFGVVNVRHSEGRITVEGRCHSGIITKGKIFTIVSEMTVVSTPEHCGPTTLKSLFEIEAKVDEIWAYGQPIDELAPSMTARLELSGFGIEQICPDSVLS